MYQVVLSPGVEKFLDKTYKIFEIDKSKSAVYVEKIAHRSVAHK